MMSPPTLQVASVNIRGSSRTIGRKDKCRKLLVAGHGPMADARAPFAIHQSGVLAPKPPFLDTLQSAFQRRRLCASPFASAITIIFSQRITLVRSKVRTGKGSRTALLQYPDCLEFGKRPVLKELASPPPSTSSSFLSPMTNTCIFRSFRDTHTNWRTQHRSVHITRPFLPSARYK
jgi:hypothetical protein